MIHEVEQVPSMLQLQMVPMELSLARGLRNMFLSERLT